MNSDITAKSAYKLLQQLESDPQLQSIEDTSILKDEQYPVSFEPSIINLKDNIPLTSAVMILRWNETTDVSNLTKDQLISEDENTTSKDYTKLKFKSYGR